MTTTMRREARPSTQYLSWMAKVMNSVTTPVIVIWLSAAMISVFTPDMVTGSAHEHLPIAAMTVWLWATVGTGYTLMGVRRVQAASGLVLGVSSIWLAAAVAAICAPEMVTGTDPTRIPMAALLVPIVAAVTTGFLTLHHATATAG